MASRYICRKRKLKYQPKRSASTKKQRLVTVSRLPPYLQSMGLGNQLKTTLRYCERNVSLNPGVSGAVASYAFSCNGLYDPNKTGIGHQPIAFDQIMLMFDHYVVTGATITAYCQNQDSTYQQFVGIQCDDNAASLVTHDPNTLIEQGRGKWALLDQFGTSADTRILKMRVDPNKFMSRSNALCDPELKGSVTANPVEQCFFQLWAAPVISADSSQCIVTVVIDYEVTFIEPKTLAGS